MGEMLDGICAGLNEDQREAALAVRGPVVIVAGAGTGKTTTVTRRIAAQVATDVFAPNEILAVTFSTKAAGELRERLGALGVAGVRAMTFHAEALGQFRRFVDDELDLISSKAQILLPMVRKLPKPHVFTPVRELATEIERAKNRRIPARDYLEKIDGQPPIPVELMHKIYVSYEKEKRRRKLIDFEDLLERLAEHLNEHDRDLGIVRSRYAAFTVDEYQDVNLLQHTLLDTWLGSRDELCVVGDDFQSIYGFTGASPAYLLRFADRFPHAHIVTLRENHRSTPQIIGVANRLVPHLGGTKKTLQATREAGPPVTVDVHATGADEVRSIVARIRREIGSGTPPSEIAVLVRINARTEPFEEALAAARIPYQVRDGSFLRRPAARAFLARARGGASGQTVAESVAEITRALGRVDSPDDGLPDDELTRQDDLRRLVQLAETSVAPDLATFVADLHTRFASDDDAGGVQLLTLHRSKGLEFDVVFLPEIEEGLLPISHAKQDEEVAEERRLLYVGITRARRVLALSRAANRPGERRTKPKASRFLEELNPSSARPSSPALAGRLRVASETPRRSASDDPKFGALRSWRSERAKEQNVPAYIVFPDSTLSEIAARMPATRDELRAISGVGPMKLSRYGDDVLALLDRIRAS